MASKWKWKEVYIKEVTGQEDLLREVNMGKRNKEGGKMKIRSRYHKSTDKEGEDCMQDKLDAQEVYEQNVQDCMDYQFQDEEAATYRNER